MKAVIYHADGPIAKKFDPGTYEKLFDGFRQNAHSFDMPLVHITLKGHPGWGDENYYIDGSPDDIVYNREVAFTNFLRTAPDDVYWFTEPDARLHTAMPELDCDLALLRRDDVVAISPWWRIARPSALPFFEEVLEHFDPTQKSWHGDSWAFVRMWENMGKPGIGHVNYRGLNIDLRDYNLYTKQNSQYSRQWKAKNKINLLNLEKGQ
jgi:hypothetical protein